VKRATGNVAKAAGGTGVGALVGGLAGGRKGAAIGAAVGAGASILMIQIAADAPNIRFAAGSRITIEAAGRNGSVIPTSAAPAPASTSQGVPTPPTAPAAAPPVQAAAAAAPAQAPVAPAAASTAQPEMTTLKSAFIPGEKTIFYDDFTDMSAGDAPPHFKVRGAAPELRAAGAIRQLTVIARGSLFPNLTSLPKNFTYEAEIKMDGLRRVINTMILSSKEKEQLHIVLYCDPAQMDIVTSLRAPYQELGRKRIPMNWSEPMKLALWIQNGRMRVFTNGEKQLDFNQVDLPEINKVEFATSLVGPEGQSLGYRSMRFAESTPDFSQVIASSGRYVTHGILFDTGSDRIKAESAPVIQGIAKGLETNPNLKLLIEGHTDSVGNAAQNLDLSKRRAEAVKAVLTAQFNVDSARLSTAGLGATKPMDSNDTPQGRAQNRRVELVKQ
jgi:outer membrane protein OmpA-like peptidoglycan-associated protein